LITQHIHLIQTPIETETSITDKLEGTSNHKAIIRPIHSSSNAVGINTGIQWELDRCCVHNTNDISTPRSLNNSKEWTVQTIFCVKLNYLLVVVGSLQQFDSVVHIYISRIAIQTKQNKNKRSLDVGQASENNETAAKKQAR
jgi:hypothetical protein